jgi:ubiquitin-protein ligase
MSSTNSSKRLWTEYSRLKSWAANTDPLWNRFSVETSSFDDSTMMPSSESNNGAAASTTQAERISMFGLIYPSTEPFRNRGLKIEMRVPFAYPYQPPEVYMRTSIRHPNIEKNGE